jgi:hypothetical protein
MRRIALLTAFLAFVSFAISQTDYTMYENTYLMVKSDKYKEFGEAMTKHNEEFHSGGPYHANVWMVATGEYAGSFVWSMGPCTFTDLDSRPNAEDHTEDWIFNVMPNVHKIRETGYWKRADKISYTAEDSVFSKLLITVYDLDDFQSYRFKEIVGKVAEVYRDKKYEHTFHCYFPAFDMPNNRDAAIVWGFNKYAVFDEDFKFKNDYEEIHGEGSWQMVMDEYKSIVKKSVDEIWEYVPDLSGKSE